MSSPTVALLNPPFRISPHNPGSGNAMPPLWMAYLSSSLRAVGLEPLMVDALGEGLDQRWALDGRDYRGLTFGEILTRLPPSLKVLGVTCMFSSTWPLMRELLAALHQHRPDLLLVLGGEHATAMTETVFAESPVQVVVTGEGEETAQALFGLLGAQADPAEAVAGGLLRGLPGLCWRDETGALQNEGRRARVKSVDDIPPPDWRGIPLDNYFAQRCGTGAWHGHYMPILATRGCPYQCTFCTSPNMWTTKWVARDPAQVVAEMAGYQRDYGAVDFQFQDLTAVLRKRWVLDFCQEIHKAGLKCTWQFPTGTRSEAIDEETAQAMARAGCSNFALPFESGDAAVLDAVKKRVNTKAQFVAGQAALRAGIRVGGFVMVGFPCETRQSLINSYKLVLKAAWLGFREMSVHSFVPLPGTEEYHHLLAKGRIKAGDAKYDDIYHWFAIGRNASYSDVLGDRGLRWFVVFCLLSFFAVSYLRYPARLWRDLWAVVGNRGDEGRLAKLIRGQRRLRQLKVVPWQAGLPGTEKTPVATA